MPLPSTRAFLREARRQRGYSLFDLFHGFIYARWPYLYISVGTEEHPVARAARWVPLGAFCFLPTVPAGGHRRVSFADAYHGKVLTLQAAKHLVTIKEGIALPDLESVVPYALARDTVLQRPDHIAVLECPCRAARANPCLSLDVCLIVGEPFASLAADHHPLR